MSDRAPQELIRDKSTTGPGAHISPIRVHSRESVKCARSHRLPDPRAFEPGTWTAPTVPAVDGRAAEPGTLGRLRP